MKKIVFFIICLVNVSFGINITQEWRDSTSGIIQNPGTYIITEDIYSKNYGFIIDASNVTLDFNGHKVVPGYGDSTIVFNQGFEDGENGWDLSQAKSTIVKLGHYDMLKEFSDDPSCYNGNYSLAIGVPSTAQSIVSSYSYTFQRGVNYNISAMAYNHYNKNADSVRFYIKITDESGNTIHKAKCGYGIFWRGFIPIYLDFIPSNTFNGKIGFEIESTQNTPSGYVYIDDVRIQTAHIYGVIVGCDTTAREQIYMSGSVNNRLFPSYHHSKKKIQNIVVKNGIIDFGNTRPFRSFGVYFEGNSLYDTLYNMQIRVNGIASYNVGIKTPYAWRVSNCYFINDSPCGLIRDGMTVAYIKADYNTVSYPYSALIDSNVAQGSCHAGFIVRGSCDLSDNGIDEKPLIHIFRNHINIKSKYSNGFAIFSYGGAGVISEENYIGGYGRGIQYAALSKDCVQNPKILKNNINMAGLGLNQEYVVVLSGEALGIQIDGADSLEISENNIYAEAYDLWHNKVGKSYLDATCLRISEAGDGYNSRILVKNNNFIAHAFGNDGAQCVNFYAISGKDILFDENTFITNDKWISAISDNDSVLFINSLFGLGEELKPNDSLFSPFIKNDLYLPSTNIRFLNTKFSDNLSDSIFHNSYFKNSANSYLKYASIKTSWLYGWRKNINITNQLDTILIINSLNDTIKTTGNSILDLYEFKDSARTNTYNKNRDRLNFNPYRFIIGNIIDTTIYINNSDPIYLIGIDGKKLKVMKR